MEDLGQWAERVAIALQDGAYDEVAAALSALLPSPETTALLAVVRAGQSRAAVPRLGGGSPAARLLRAVGAFPGRNAAELRDVTRLDPEGFGAASRELLAAGLLTSTRFDKPDCWTRTARGTAAARLLGPDGGPDGGSAGGSAGS